MPLISEGHGHRTEPLWPGSDPLPVSVRQVPVPSPVHDNHTSSACGLIPADPCAGTGAGARELASPCSHGPLSRERPAASPATSWPLHQHCAQRGSREPGVRLRSARSLRGTGCWCPLAPVGREGGRASGQGPLRLLALHLFCFGLELRGGGVHRLSKSCLTCRARR